jgi:putative transcriptional regulator
MTITNLRLERQSRKWTLDYIAEAIGVTKQAVHDIETGKTKPSYDVLMKLCKLFNVEHEEIERLFTVAADNPNLSPK